MAAAVTAATTAVIAEMARVAEVETGQAQASPAPGVIALAGQMHAQVVAISALDN